LNSVTSPGWIALVALGSRSPEPDGSKDIGPIARGAKVVCIGTGANEDSSEDGVEEGAILLGGGGCGGEIGLSDIDTGGRSWLGMDDGGGGGSLDVDADKVGKEPGAFETGADDTDSIPSFDEVEDATVTIGTKLGGSVIGVSINDRAVNGSEIVKVVSHGTDDDGISTGLIHGVRILL
jgi:hypothetical protein